MRTYMVENSFSYFFNVCARINEYNYYNYYYSITCTARGLEARGKHYRKQERERHAGREKKIKMTFKRLRKDVYSNEREFCGRDCFDKVKFLLME